MKLQKLHPRVRELDTRQSYITYDTSTQQSYFEFPSRHHALKDALLKTRTFFKASTHILSRPVDITWIVFVAMADQIHEQFKHQPNPCFDHGSESVDREYFAFDVP